MNNPTDLPTHFTADWFTVGAEHWLKRLGHLKDRPARGLEVGSYEGRSACWFLDNLLTHPLSNLTCVDSWDGVDPCLGEFTREAEWRFDRNVLLRYPRKVIKVGFRSLQALAGCAGRPREYEFVFIDGDHEGEGALLDLLLCWPLVAPGGRLIFDDYGWEDKRLRAQPWEAFEAWLSVRPVGIAKVEQGGRMMFVRKGGGT